MFTLFCHRQSHLPLLPIVLFLIQAFHRRAESLYLPSFFLLFCLLSTVFPDRHPCVCFLIFSLSLSLSSSPPAPLALLSLHSYPLFFFLLSHYLIDTTCFFVINCLITSCEWGHQILSVCDGSASLQIWRVDLSCLLSERERDEL